MELLHPNHWRPAKGFANGVAAQGRQVFVAGQVGWNAEQEFASNDFVAQVEQALSNIREVGQAYRRVIGRHFPAMTLVQVVALLEERAKVEIEATAVIPTP